MQKGWHLANKRLGFSSAPDKTSHIGMCWGKKGSAQRVMGNLSSYLFTV